MTGLPKNAVILEPHNIKWIDEYNNVKDFFTGIFRDNIVFIEHVGSTSIDGIIAKPVLDIAIVFKDISDPVFQQICDW